MKKTYINITFIKLSNEICTYFIYNRELSLSKITWLRPGLIT